MVQENNNIKRSKIVKELSERMKKYKFFSNVEVDEPYEFDQYVINVKRKLASQVGVSAVTIGNTLRAAVEGRVLYTILDDNNEEVNVRLGFSKGTNNRLSNILKVPVLNNNNLLLSLRKLVTAKKTKSPSRIQRKAGKRYLKVMADLSEKNDKSPLEIAMILEEEIFPSLQNQYPTATFNFEGEIKDTRESTNFFLFAIFSALFLIYGILVLQFKSLIKPIIIMIAVIPTVSIVIFVFLAHGMQTYGFFAVIGVMGLSGVIVNDAIILLKKLGEIKVSKSSRGFFNAIALASSTRLRAVVLTTLTTVLALVPTAYGFAGYDSMLAEMMLAMAWGLTFGTIIILVLVPVLYSLVHKNETGSMN